MQWDTNADKAISTLEALPHLVSNTNIQKGLLNTLHRSGIGYRDIAASLLSDIGDPEGIRHLVYNSMTVHPVLKEKQTLISGWSGANLLRRSHLITDEYLELLIEDMVGSEFGWHIDIMASLPDEMVLQRMIDLLAHPADQVSFVAAAVLAMKGNVSGRGILLHLAENYRFARRAMIALSHVPNEEVMNLLRDYAEGYPAIYDEYKTLIIPLRSVARQRIEMLELRALGLESGYRKMIDRWYKHSLQEICGPLITVDEQSDIKLYIWRMFRGTFAWADDDLCVMTPMADMLYEFSTAEDRKGLALEQQTQVEKLLAGLDDPFEILGSGSSRYVANPFFRGGPHISEYDKLIPYYLPDVKFTYEYEDYIKYSTDWILHPEKYVMGSCFKL